MGAFVFKFEAVLQARQAEERRRQRAVAALERQRLQREEHLRRQHEMIVMGRQALREGLVGEIDAIALRTHAASAMRLMREAQGMAIELAQVHQRIAEARADLMEAAAARRAIELLRDRRFAKWRRTEAKREASAMDDLAATRAAMLLETFPR